MKLLSRFANKTLDWDWFPIFILAQGLFAAIGLASLFRGCW